MAVRSLNCQPQNNTTELKGIQIMATRTKVQSDIARHPFFSDVEKPEGILIPDIPIFVQANCAQNGSWVVGEKSLGNDPLEFFILAFQFGQEHDPYKDVEIQTGTLWFVPVDDTLLRSGLVYATKIKNQASGRKGSLSNFGNRVAELVVSGYDPREVIWEAKFMQKSGYRMGRLTNVQCWTLIIARSAMKLKRSYWMIACWCCRMT
jgi:hypothetical protein